VAAMTPQFEKGTWGLLQPGCFLPFFNCYTSQETYIDGEVPKTPFPLNPEWAADFKRIQDALKEGLSVFDPDALCHPAGIPYKLRSGNFTFSFQENRIYVIWGGLLDYRVIHMDGRKIPTVDPVMYTYNGYSVGRWEGNTLVVETRNLRGADTQIGPHVPKSDNFWVVERYTPVSTELMDFEITMKDEDRWTAPYTEKYQIRRNPEGELTPQSACISGAGQRYEPDPVTGAMTMTGPGGVALEQAEE
jgi:hypothetical protein